MEEKELKTSTAQRIWIALIAIIMVGSMIVSYAAIIIGGSQGDSETAGIGNERIAYYEEGYNTKLAEFKEATAADFKKFWGYSDAISEYDETAANAGGVATRDYHQGSGRELTEEDTDYLAYYVGWCADGSIFDSSLDNTEAPEAFSKALNASQGMIDGWNTGVVGMHIGGVREITVPDAYGEDLEVCGGYHKPLRFLMMPVANEEPLKTLASELDLAYLKLYYAYYGIDYERDYE